MSAPVARGDAAALLRALTRIDSRNPSLVPGGPGEGPVARALAEILTAWGFRTEVRDSLPGRPNVIARIGAARGGRTLILNGHLNVVGTEGMLHAPFEAQERDGKLYGRGSADMKGGVAAMCAAAARAQAAGALEGEAIVTAVADEEWASAGTKALLDAGLRADAAIVTEPTRLAIMPAHRGFVWCTVTFRGRAAHGSRYDLGVDAIRHAGLLLTELDAFEHGPLAARTHPLLGRGSLHASTIEGGTGMSTYPERCVLRIERRTLPGERAESALDRDPRRVRARAGAASAVRRGGDARSCAGTERCEARRARGPRARERDHRGRGRAASRGNERVDRRRAPERRRNSRHLLRARRHRARACGGGIHPARGGRDGREDAHASRADVVRRERRMARLTPAQYDALERAVTKGSRIAIDKRGTEFVVIAHRLVLDGGRERIETVHPSTGQPLVFYIDEVDRIQVIA